jgi:hypothetical protein
MGKRDFSRREAKKPKKGIKKPQTTIFEPQENEAKKNLPRPKNSIRLSCIADIVCRIW